MLYQLQLIGWQEVSRPNSRNEIVQAMRRIRVSINSTTILPRRLKYYKQTVLR